MTGSASDAGEDPTLPAEADAGSDPTIRAGDPSDQLLRAAVRQRLFGGDDEPVRIARFPVLRRLGAGGMGVVYAAYDNELDRRIAIKLLRPETSGDVAGLRARLLREAKALARLSHPSVVQVYEAGEHEGQVYVAMEFVEGHTLREWMHEARRGPAEIVAVFAAAGRGLAAAHSAGLVHRDFKPDNVLVGSDGRVCVLDFGLAVAALTEDSVDTVPSADDDRSEGALDRLTRTGSILGTPAYMAPEQFVGASADPRTDQFGFAVALFEGLYGERPFGGNSFVELSERVQEGRVTWPAERDVSSRLQRVLRRALAVRPDDRYESMDELVAALEHATSNRRRNLMLGGVVAVVGLGAASTWIDAALGRAEERADALSAEVDTERTRADTAEANLQRRADALALAEARFAARRDPTRGVALLANLSPTADEWHEAWTLAQSAVADGIARHVTALPEGWSGVAIVDRDTLVLGDPLDPRRWAIWTRSTDTLKTIEPLGEGLSNQLSPDRRWLSQAANEGLVVYEVATGRQKRLGAGAWQVTFSPGSRCAATRTTDGLTAWDLETGVATSFEGGAPFARWVSDDCSSLLAIDHGRYVHHTASGPPVVGPDAPPMGLGFSDDGVLALGVDGSALRVTDLRATDREWNVDLEAPAAAATVRPSTHTVAVGTGAGDVLLVDADDPHAKPRRLRGGHDGPVESLHWAEDRLLSIGDDGVVLWDVEGAAARGKLRSTDAVASADWHDPARVLVLGESQLRSYAVPGTAAQPGATASLTAAHGAILRVLAGSHVEWTPAGATEPITLPHEGVGATAIAPGGRLAATAVASDVRIWSATGALQRQVDLDRGRVVDLAFVDAEHLAFASSGSFVRREDDPRQPGTVGIVTVADGTVRSLASDPATAFDAPISSPDGTTLYVITTPVVVTDDSVSVLTKKQRVVPFDVATGERRVAIDNPPGHLRAFAVSPVDGSLVLAGSAGIDVVAGDTRRRLSDASGIWDAIAISPDGALLVANEPDGPVRVWEIATGREVTLPLGNSSEVLMFAMRLGQGPRGAGITFTDETTVVAVGADAVARAFRLDVPRDRETLRKWVAAATDLRAAAGEIGEPDPR